MYKVYDHTSFTFFSHWLAEAYAWFICTYLWFDTYLGYKEYTILSAQSQVGYINDVIWIWAGPRGLSLRDAP